MRNISPSRSPYHTALLEIGMLFLPAIPAYLWAWPNLKGLQLDIFQSLAYLYVLAGTLFIGLRRWNLDQLGVNRRGWWLTFGCGLTILGARLMIILSIDWQLEPPQLGFWEVIWDLFFYIGLVGLVEELLFRGLLYRLLEDWRGLRWAIWGSSAGFFFWHLFGHGPAAALATFLIGLLFALLRWRGGGILGLILFHGFWDIQGAWMVSDSSTQILTNASQITFTNQALVLVGTALLFLVPVFLWKIYPLMKHRPAA